MSWDQLQPLPGGQFRELPELPVSGDRVRIHRMPRRIGRSTDALRAGLTGDVRA